MTSPSPLAGATQSPSSANPPSNSNNSLADPATFITLLTTQLKAQDPLDPMSPSDMVTQLTQVNSLQQLMQIQQDLQTMLQGSTTQNAASQTNSSAGTTPTNNQ